MKPLVFRECIYTHKGLIILTVTHNALRDTMLDSYLQKKRNRPRCVTNKIFLIYNKMSLKATLNYFFVSNYTLNLLCKGPACFPCFPSKPMQGVMIVLNCLEMAFSFEANSHN